MAFKVSARPALVAGLLIAGVAWAAGADKDGDGVPNSADACPTVMEDSDGFRDRDGCPDRDNDADGVPDGKDSCPNAPGRDGAACPDYAAPVGVLVASPSGAKQARAAGDVVRKQDPPGATSAAPSATSPSSSVPS